MIHDVFSGGRAPHAWQRGLARAAAPLGALRRSVAWLAELARLRPRLREEPLLGRCFNDLALEPFPSAEPKPAEARPAPTRPRLDDLPSRLSRSSAAEPGSHRERRQPPPEPRREETRREKSEEDGTARHAREASEPLALEARAGREVLERLAGRAKVDAERPHPLSPSPISHPGLRPSPAGRGGTPLKGNPDDPASPFQSGSPSPGDRAGGRWERGTGGEVSARRTALRTWLEGVSRRLGLSLTEAGKAPSPSLPRFAGEGATAPPREALDLPAPWRLSLTGETAPAELLERWRTPGLDAPARTSRPGSSPGSPSRTNPLSRAQSEPLSRGPVVERLDDPAETRRSSQPAEAAHQDTTLLPPPPSLPPFLQTKGAGDGIARNPTPEVKTVLTPPVGPAVPVGEDLDALAAKIQRILDEEARRHGIPV